MNQTDREKYHKFETLRNLANGYPPNYKMKVIYKAIQELEKEEDETSYEGIKAKLKSMKKEDRDEYRFYREKNATEDEKKMMKKAMKEIIIEEAQEESDENPYEDVDFDEDGMREHFERKDKENWF